MPHTPRCDGVGLNVPEMRHAPCAMTWRNAFVNHRGRLVDLFDCPACSDYRMVYSAPDPVIDLIPEGSTT